MKIENVEMMREFLEVLKGVNEEVADWMACHGCEEIDDENLNLIIHGHLGSDPVFCVEEVREYLVTD